MTQEWDLTRRIERINGVTARANRDNFLHELTGNLTSDKLEGNEFGDELKVSVLSRMHPLVRMKQWGLSVRILIINTTYSLK